MHTYTWDKLVKNSARLNPRSRGSNYPYTPKFELEMIMPYIGTKSCLVKLRAWGVTQNKLHSVTLLFSDCDVTKEEQSLINYFKVQYKGETYYVKKFNKFVNPLTHRCSCADFFFSWAYGNYYNGNCLYGPAPKKYQRRTTWYPPRNPNSIIGTCKHVKNAWTVLKDNGLTVN